MVSLFVAVREANTSAGKRRQSNAGFAHARHGGAEGGARVAAACVCADRRLLAACTTTSTTGIHQSLCYGVCFLCLQMGNQRKKLNGF